MTSGDEESAPSPQGPPHYPVSPKSRFEDANWQRFEASTAQPPARPAPQPRTLDSLPRNRYGTAGMMPVSQLALAFAVLAPTWFIMQVAFMVAYDGLLSMIGLMLASALMPIAAIAGAITIGLPLRLVPALNRWWAGNGRAYISIAAIAVGLVIAGCVKTVRQLGEVDGIPYDTFAPDPTLMCGGWLLLAFLLVNASLPLRWANRAGS
ncbi:hypothetical protein ACIQH5_06235 [Paenarthrobacter sp. NPDC091711]|uniref:hypothetical protein n=1 Tax=Paenarthrobacter sp. NPDC091711 TaxID=3364385 RepID=UPI00381EC4A2